MKILCLLLIFFIFSASVSAAGIVADQEINNSVVFYFWDHWVNSSGLGTGAAWLTFIKHISQDGSEKYWLRADIVRRDTLLQHGRIISGTTQHQIEMIDNPLGIHYRAGIGGRANPSYCPIHAFYWLTEDMLKSMSLPTTEATIFLDFQNRKDYPFKISETNRGYIAKLLTLKMSDYEEYKRKPSK